MSNGATIVGSQRSVTDANTANGPPACPLPSVSRAFRCAGVARPSMSTSCVPCPRWTAPGHIPGRATPRPSSFTSPYAPLSMTKVYTPRQLPCDGGASKLHGHPQSQLHSPRRDPDIRHSETMIEPVPRGNGGRMIKDAATSQLECNPGGHNMHRLRISGYRRAAVSRSRGYACSRRLRRLSSRDSDREGHRSQHEDRGDEERHARKGRGGIGTDEPGEDQREQDRTEDARQARDACVGALQLPLFRRTDAARHETLQRRLDKADRREHDDREEEDVGSRGETPHDERGGSGDQARDQRLPLSEALY